MSFKLIYFDGKKLNRLKYCNSGQDDMYNQGITNQK